MIQRIAVVGLMVVTTGGVLHPSQTRYVLSVTMTGAPTSACFTEQPGCRAYPLVKTSYRGNATHWTWAFKPTGLGPYAFASYTVSTYKSVAAAQAYNQSVLVSKYLGESGAAPSIKLAHYIAPTEWVRGVYSSYHCTILSGIRYQNIEMETLIYEDTAAGNGCLTWVVNVTNALWNRTVSYRR